MFASAVRAPGNQAEYVNFSTPTVLVPLNFGGSCPVFGSHHLEYGFPSTHTTNGVSIALFLYSHVHRLYFSESSISSTSYYTYLAAIIFYASSIVFGRIYTAMHSFTDCAFGIILGTAIWALQHLYLGRVDAAIVNGGWVGKS